MSQVQAMKKQVCQLRQEANVDRITVSEACEDLIKYCSENQKNDILVTGITPSENPYKENKSYCVVHSLNRIHLDWPHHDRYLMMIVFGDLMMNLIKHHEQELYFSNKKLIEAKERSAEDALLMTVTAAAALRFV
uniref:Guanine nucleotide-binding protein subunit gamma n=1 Tax=Strigamia maritima TaxID=126957 RepID=T1IVX5_STRMM